MMSTPIVSVVLPSFNAASTLSQAIKSVCDQSFPDWELILIDDGSTDGSCELAANAARSDERFQVIKSEHVGIVRALNAGCAVARGRYIARMDADDVSHPNRLALQVELMERDPSVALCGTLVKMVGETVRRGRRRYEQWINNLVTHEDIVRELFIECPIPHPTFLIRRTWLERVGGYQDAGWAEDYDLCMRLFSAGARFAKVPQVLLDWTESHKRLSMTDDRYSQFRFRELKRHYLFETYLKGRPFHQWGAGEIGKLWLREWTDRRPVAVVDTNLRKIGSHIHGIPVIAPDDLPPPGETFTVIAVGAPDARPLIREWMQPRGYQELKDYLFLA